MSWRLPFVNRDELTLSDDVPGDRAQQIGASQARFQPEIRVERVDDEMIMMRLAGRRRRAAIDGAAETGHALDRTADLGWHRRGRIDRDPFGQSFCGRWNPVDHPVHE